MEKTWKGAVGPPHMFDILGIHQLGVLVQLGLREHHSVLDIGSGVFRAGRFIARYTKNYYAVEPSTALTSYGYEMFLEEDKVKGLLTTTEFDYSGFGKPFDYVLCHALLTHFDKADIAKFIHQIRAILHNGSFLIATFHIDENNSVGKKSWTAPLIAHTEESILEIVEHENMKCTFLGISHPMGQRWALIRL